VGLSSVENLLGTELWRLRDPADEVRKLDGSRDRLAIMMNDYNYSARIMASAARFDCQLGKSVLEPHVRAGSSPCGLIKVRLNVHLTHDKSALNCDPFHHNKISLLVMIRNAKDLSPEQKTAIESLLGRRLVESEDISVRAFEPSPVSDRRRLEIADDLRKYFAEVDANRKDVSDEEAEEIINEALRSSRPNYQPLR
jgi:hypothetical protein